MIRVIATIEIEEGKLDAYLAEFKKIVPDVLAEDGCVDYAPYVDTPSGLSRQEPLRPNTVVVVEQWESLDALNAHLKAPHMNTLREATKGMVAGMKLEILKPA